MQFRKVIHISGVFIPVIAGSIGKYQAIALLSLGFAFFLLIETLKPGIDRNILSMFYRENELEGFSIEPFSYIISVLSLLYLSFFIDERICFAAIAILAAGDGFAGVIGRKYGKHRFHFNRNKSWEGSLSGLAVALITGFYFAGIISVIGAFFGMAAGAVNRNDNIAVPYSALISMMMFEYIMNSA